MATALHWFCSEKDKAARRIYSKLRTTDRLTSDFFEGILNDFSKGESGSSQILWLPSPEKLEELISKPDEETLRRWTWDQLELRDAESDSDEARVRKHLSRSFVSCLKGNRELLIYAQRHWMWKQFGDFDRANPTVWDEHNRPWDYDHLLVQSAFRNKRKWPFLRVCQAWGRTIGNLHVESFEANRSRGDKDAEASFRERDEKLIFLDSGYPREAFSLRKRDESEVMRFALAARKRLIAIYADWFNSGGIAFLVGLPALKIDGNSP